MARERREGGARGREAARGEMGQGGVAEWWGAVVRCSCGARRDEDGCDEVGV